MTDFVRPHGKHIGMYREMKLALFKGIAALINDHKVYSLSVAIPQADFKVKGFLTAPSDAPPAYCPTTASIRWQRSPKPATAAGTNGGARSFAAGSHSPGLRDNWRRPRVAAETWDETRPRGRS
jgi:hypothetical protein